LAGVLVGGGLSYKNHNKLVEIGNVTNFRVAESSVQHPYNIHIQRVDKEGFLYTYIVNTRTADSIEIHKDMAIGNFDYRLNNVLGQEGDIESIVGKYTTSKEKVKTKLENIYNSVKNYFNK
jgi:hypothetical protein